MSGYRPFKEDITLSRGADFIHRYEVTDELFPAGTSAEILVSKTSTINSPIVASWPASDLNETYIEFWVQSDVVDLIPARYHYRMLVHYPALPPNVDELDFCWYRGNIKRED